MYCCKSTRYTFPSSQLYNLKCLLVVTVKKYLDLGNFMKQITLSMALLQRLLLDSVYVNI